MSPAQIILSIFLVFGFLLAIMLFTIFKAPHENSPLVGLTILTTMLLLTRLSILVKVGIGFVTFILFPVTLFFGAIPALIMIAITTFIYLQIATRPTPFDFAITKGVQSSIAQFIYFSLWVITLVPIFRILGTDYVLANLTFVYMLSIGIYVVYMIIFLPFFAREPLPMALINGMVMFPIQFFFITYLGERFFNYVMTLAAG